MSCRIVSLRHRHCCCRRRPPWEDLLNLNLVSDRASALNVLDKASDRVADTAIWSGGGLPDTFDEEVTVAVIQVDKAA